MQMKKSIIINGLNFEYFFDERVNSWRMIDSPDLIRGHTIDVEINLANFNEGLNWGDLEKFIKFILDNQSKHFQSIEDAKYVLHSFFKVVNKNSYDPDFFKAIDFNLSGIDYKGHSKNITLADSIEFDYFFFPVYTKDIYRDIGSFVWRANFRDNILLGVYCDGI